MTTITNYIEYQVVTPDGSYLRIALSPDWERAETTKAPIWLLHQLGLSEVSKDSWNLRPLPSSLKGASILDDSGANVASPKVLCLVRDVTAGASKTPFDPRQARLKTERLRLEKINQESDYVRIEPIDVLEGSEPDHYQVTFLCKGIGSIDPSTRMPIYREKHEVLIHCDDDFPSDVPRLRWNTPIWHPNIQHEEPKGVCVNKAEWLGGMGLDDLCRLMFEMVQYKNYHATLTKPHPLDHDVAHWVLDFAEPNDIVNKKKGKFVDDKPFTRPTETRFITVQPSTLSAPPPPRIKIVTAPSTTNPAPSSRIKVVSSASPPAQTGSSQSSATRIKVVKKE